MTEQQTLEIRQSMQQLSETLDKVRVTPGEGFMLVSAYGRVRQVLETALAPSPVAPAAPPRVSLVEVAPESSSTAPVAPGAS